MKAFQSITVVSQESISLDEELKKILEFYDTSVQFIESAAHREQIGPAKFSKFYSTNWSNDFIPRADSIKASYDFLQAKDRSLLYNVIEFQHWLVLSQWLTDHIFLHKFYPANIRFHIQEYRENKEYF